MALDREEEGKLSDAQLARELEAVRAAGTKLPKPADLSAREATRAVLRPFVTSLALIVCALLLWKILQ